MILKHLASIFAVIAVSLGGTTATAQFPEFIEECIAQGDCTTPTFVSSSPLVGGTPLVEQYQYLDTNDNTLMNLIRYSIGSDSDFQSTFESSELSGAAWLSSNVTYDLADSDHELLLFTDQISGDGVTIVPAGFGGGPGFITRDINLTLSSDALLAGEGSFLTGLFESVPPSSFPPDFSFPDEVFDLTSDGPFICLSEACFVTAELDLLNLSYQQVGGIAVSSFSSFLNPDGQPFYSEGVGFFGDPIDANQTVSDAIFSETSFVVGTAVPEPGTAAVLGFALGLFTLGRRRI